MEFDKPCKEKNRTEKSRHIGFEVRTLSNLIRRHVDSFSAEREIDSITGVQRWVIGYLFHRQDRDVFQRDLEKEFLIRRSTATAILQLMEKNGLITRERVDQDARLKRLLLTPKAKEIHTMIMKEIEAFEKTLTYGIPEEEMAAFFQTLEKIKGNIR